MSRPSLRFPLWVPLAAVVITTVGVRLVTMSSDQANPEPQVPMRQVVAIAPKSNPTPAKPSVSPVTERVAEMARAVPAPATKEAPARAAGMVVGIHPETGRPGMPTPEQREEIRNAAGAALQSSALDRSGEGLQVVHRPDGSRSIDLQGRFHEYAVIRIRPNGAKEQTCVQGPDLEAALGGKDHSAPSPTEPTESRDRTESTERTESIESAAPAER